jgi:hypothetical protein
MNQQQRQKNWGWSFGVEFFIKSPFFPSFKQQNLKKLLQLGY